MPDRPAGDPRPSNADLATTEAVDRAGQAVGIVLHDRLIVACDGQVSLKELDAL